MTEVKVEDGTTYTVQWQEYRTAREGWNEYVLDDGVRVRFKATVVKIGRVLDADGKPMTTDGDDPMVFVRSQNIVIASDPDEGSN